MSENMEDRKWWRTISPSTWGATTLACAMLVGVLLLSLCSCTKTIYVPTETTKYHTDTLRLTQLRIDSIVERDSIVVIERGDTVYKTVWKERLRWRERIDTIYQSIVDTARIEVPYPVEKQLSRWEKTMMHVGGMATGVIVLVILAVIAWLIIKVRRKL